MSFYRPEVFEKKKSSLWGEVIVAPTRFYLRSIAVLIFTAFVSLLLVTTRHYFLKETVTGVIEPQQGMVSLYAPVSGYVSGLSIKQGDLTSSEQILFKISEHPKTHSGENYDESFRGLLLSDCERIDAQLDLLQDNAKIKFHEISLEQESTKNSLKICQEQKELLKVTSQNLNSRLKDLEVAYTSGAISSLQMKNFEAEARAKEQEVLSLDERILALQNKLEQLSLKKIDVEKSSDEQRILLSQKKTDLQKQIIEFDRREGASIYSQNAMKLTQINVQEGQYIQSGTHLLNLEHQSDDYVAVLQIPESSVGLVEEGMDVNLRLHAYPYEHYGILSGKISHLSESAVFDPGSGMYFYKAFVTLSNQEIYGNGRSYKLRQGLVFEADIKTQKITLISKIFEPLKRFKKI